jgi:transposase
VLEGKIRSHHRFLLRRLLDPIQCVEHKIALLDQRLEEIGSLRPELAQSVERWDTIPGFNRAAAWALLAEIGDNMAKFPTAEQLASWAALVPRQSSGKGSWQHLPVLKCAVAAAWQKVNAATVGMATTGRYTLQSLDFLMFSQNPNPKSQRTLRTAAELAENRIAL